MNKPTVTQLVALLDKPALLRWANKIGLQGTALDDYRSKSQKSGSDIHAQIENYLALKLPLDMPEEHAKCEAFFADKEVIATEKNIETDWFIGRTDLVMKWKERTWVCDFKSNQSAVYFENKLQLAAYRMAEQADGVAIISVPDFRMMPVPIKDFTPYEEMLKCLSRFYQLKESA